MAVSFNATTSKLEDTTFSGLDLATMTVLFWAFANSSGEGSAARVVTASEVGPATEGWMVNHRLAASTIGFHYTWSTSVGSLGSWNVSATDSQWNAIAFAYDRGSTTNDPTARVNFAAATVTETSAPSGSPVSPATGYCIGNNTTQTRTWDGCLAHIQVFSGILSDADQDAALTNPGSVTSGGILWVPILTAGDLVAYTVSGGAWVPTTAPTPTALTNCSTMTTAEAAYFRNDAPIYRPRLRSY